MHSETRTTRQWSEKMDGQQQTGRTRGRGRIYENIVETVGDTPVVRINHLAPEGVEIASVDVVIRLRKK